jgi:hypothetical protein
LHHSRCCVNSRESPRARRHARPAAAAPPHGNFDWTTIAFLSDTSIAVGLCSKGNLDPCSLSLIRWRDGALQPSAHTSAFDAQTHILPASDGRILTACYYPCKSTLYSADLSTSLPLPASIFVASPSGRVVATATKDGWNLYHLSSTLDFVREGRGLLISVSDEAVIFQDDDKGILHIETLAGKLLGSFSVRLEYTCATKIEPLVYDKLYLSDCLGEGIVDFNGYTQLKLNPPKGCCYHYNRWQANLFPWSADGSRLLFDHKSRQVSLLRTIGEISLEVAFVGNADLRTDNNHQEVRVVDTVTGALCFDWQRSFPMPDDAHFVRAASLSPSGEFVAIAAEKTLSIYRLPVVCGTQ